MNAFKRDQVDSLMPELLASKALYKTAYAKGKREGYIEGIRAATKMFEDAAKAMPPRQA